MINKTNKNLLGDWLEVHLSHSAKWSVDSIGQESVCFIFCCNTCEVYKVIHFDSVYLISWMKYHKSHIMKYQINVRSIDDQKQVTLDLACQCGENYTIKISE